MSRAYNFSAGPAALPESVLAQVRDELLEWNAERASVMEVSHRGQAFIDCAAESERDLRELMAVPDDYHVLFLQGAREGIAVLRSLTNAPEWEPPQPEGTVTELDRAIDILVEMKNISEVAVGLAYSALVLRDRGLATEVNHLARRIVMERDRSGAARLAESGIEHTYAVIARNPAAPPSRVAGELAEGSYEVSIQMRDGGRVELVSSGRGRCLVVRGDRDLNLGGEEPSTREPVGDTSQR